MVRCGMMSFAEKAAQQSQEHRIQTQLLGEIKDLKNYIDDAVASVERNIRLTAKVPVEIIQKKINRGIEIIIELGDRPSAGLYRMFFNISYPKWLNRIRAVQEGICQETMYYTSCIQCQQRCEASLYVPPRGPDGGCNVDALDCTPGCICPKSNDWLLPNGTCVDSCPMENPIAIEPEEESVKDNLISALDQFKPAKSDGIECPSGMRFSTCKAHCQKRCGEDDPICDASLCRPGCICEDETAVLWENGKTCAPECLIMKPTTPPPKLPPQCIDQMETCSDVIPLCDNPDINFICPFSCKADHCSEYFTTAPPTTAAYVPAVTMRPTTISTTVDPRTDCEDMHKTCPQLANHCGIPGYRIAAICMKTCKMCHMKATIEEANNKKQTSKTTTPKPTTKSITPTTTPAPSCVDQSNNCAAYRNFCMEESIRKQCNKTCGVCKVNIGLCRQQFEAAKAGVWKPRCDGNGNFLAKQCNDAARVCWCATLKDGKEVLNTRSFMEDPTLMPQMTCTVENGVYVSNFGGQDLYQVKSWIIAEL